MLVFRERSVLPVQEESENLIAVGPIGQQNAWSQSTLFTDRISRDFFTLLRSLSMYAMASNSGSPGRPCLFIWR